ncbi:1-deoxy-D-xylulose-5-phosphate synthase [Candidatus Azobacteroides pseudotrichonymphae]|uniref:1-deoxy-D-xylulose-5-phosphate synthase n=1 Tax=Azobacteroides pseudotrichonymphae genomovar. CFP2 TaxID=511995 RepID=DXS_AZOPC|nr:1-deoxy-D-xylulose-5-phosphate synthase [Candidatus Azobacteroides pseudotrichonymphae]B6YRV5.1 RecName: Full=1-deoxy-D-xylulose-5-phosphate synthase; AltName: Full=1-deoxyxylulose-5-phosphate synthase; Short=DXP synthase; Short=DXPS [Candidatus Azobacteroides pseudotrichonymphae genomovar. CFP2]BAG83927.1 1-deoxy-D-xylulose-5-phosphate synthase [Candidatus Azobacteroides pseudotrichonymphae genomovar. CFP2]
MKKISDYSLLFKINSPEDLRKLAIEQVEQVCKELREYIIEVLSENPGHLGSNLGTVELTVALHYVFNTPYDRIVWDVGHQAYGHKILTERRESFHTLRKLGGISGFPNPQESEYDAFIAGHASNSISAALGMAIASWLKGENRKIVAIIGDGSITGGLAFEGLNNVSSNPNDLLIVLNDNNMAIDRSVGGLSQSLIKITTSYTYNTIRFKLYNFLKKYSIIKERERGFILRFTNSLKALLTKQHNIFEGLNIRYFGPIDGHNIKELVKVFEDIKSMKGPKLLHVCTVKGKGFGPAENKADVWHAPGKFNPETGERIKVWSENLPSLYQDVFGHTLVELARMNNNIVGVTPAMSSGCSMTFLMKEMPHRTFDVGIAEGHAITFAAGLAKEGMIPFCNVYSSFMQRAYDNIIHDAVLQNLNMILCLDRAGLVGEDGVTHHGVLDLAYLRCIPNITITAPLNEKDLRNLMFTAIQPNAKGVFVIRYPKGYGELKNWEYSFEALPVGKGRKLKEGKEIAVVSIGTIGNLARKAIRLVEKLGISVAHYDMIYLKPIDEELLHEIGKNYRCVVVIEDGTIKGGLGTAVIEFMVQNGYDPKIKQIGVPDEFIPHGTIAELYKLCGMDIKSIVKCLIEEK